MNFTNDEMNLMCIYSAEGNRTELMEKLAEMKRHLESDEAELLTLTDSTLTKLAELSDVEFEALELIPDFDV
mgnify:FL=1